ncbi:peptidylprolyl isomerase [Erythrobacter sp. SCSIO 43205]|uniref:peptidylprolyl isomerase n=1 Tax=Erythrobacter sp. SCSIO 43205 TaxID=2779361 RepID=UPI001CA81F59|nr:peptidylprolyl isomerase [Erythrobacter sp. SCSIO 43205]UAB77315.1 peptidylprolyl isomerase [Erythrobacter sp. SCSIO 43205]
MRRFLTAALSGVISLALGLSLPGPAHAQDEFFVETQPVDLNESDPSQNQVGELIFRGGLDIDPGEEDIGGISGLTWHNDRLFAVGDDGHWFSIQPDEINGTLIDLLTFERGELLDERGKRLKGKDEADAEAISFIPQLGWWISFEREHRISYYADLNVAAQSWAIGMEDAPPLPFRIRETLESNKGIETLAHHSRGMLACEERFDPDMNNCVRFDQFGEADYFQLAPPPELAEHSGAPTDAACKEDGTCFVLFRSYREGEGNRAAIVKLPMEGEPEVLAVLTPPLTLDNFEGLAVREQFGKTFLYIASDNNFSDTQRNLLMKFEVMTKEQLIAATPEPEVNYETKDVVLETTKGDITIRLEVERAPITAANFLRYVDEGRFDGTVFYRAMKLNRDPMPNGLIQGGTQFDPKRILPGIPHEPTTETGLSHTNGAVSMAMLEPGTANGDFSIMLADQIGLDANPDSDDPTWQAGFAVFGYVIDGMDVVSAIHAGEADPNKGEGVMVGQMLADPVEIVKARRAERAVE